MIHIHTAFLAVFLSTCLPVIIAEIVIGENVFVLDNGKATLECTGTNDDLKYYIDNRVSWYFTGADGKQRQLTYGTNFIYFDAANRGYYNYTYGEEGQRGFYFHLEINSVTPRDVGTYTCSLLSKYDEILESKSLTLYIARPVQGIEMTLTYLNNAVIVTSSREVTAMPIKPGVYDVRCDAYGSIPEPSISLYLDDKLIKDQVKSTKEVVTSNFNGTIHVNGLEIMPKNSTRSLLCIANNPIGNFPAKEADILVNVTQEYLGFVCTDVNAFVGAVGVEIRCSINQSSDSMHEILDCDKVFWRISSQNDTVVDIIENTSDVSLVAGRKVTSVCKENERTLASSLLLGKIHQSDFELTFVLIYGDKRYGPRVDLKLEQSLHDRSGFQILSINTSVYWLLLLTWTKFAF